MHLYIYTLDKTLFEGETTLITIPSETGELSVLPNHAPIITSLKKGTITVKTKSDSKTFPIESGFAEINQKQVILLVK